MKKFIHDLIVKDKRILNKDYYILDLTYNEKLPEILPGQFAEMLIKGNENVFLRRPFSVHDVDYDKNIMSILIQKVGNGTVHLEEIKIGDKLNTVYPLGNTFGLADKGSKVLLVGGGCGVAPLLYLSRFLKANNVETTVLIGVRSKNYLIEIDKYKQFANILVTTEDGSEGTKGFVTNHEVFNNLKNFDKVYTCGPEVMMKAVAKRAKEQAVDCEVSLENTMACGIGACLCCVTDTVRGNVCVCTEGPIFNINELKW